MSEEITFDDIEFGEPIEEREPDYRDGYIRGIYRAKNIIDSKQKEIERLNNIIKTKDEGIKAFTEDLCEESTKIEKAIEYIEKHTYYDYHYTPKKLQSGIYERGELIIKNDFYIEDLVDILKGVMINE